jgi:hypothetical protein
LLPPKKKQLLVADERADYRDAQKMFKIIFSVALLIQFSKEDENALST